MRSHFEQAFLVRWKKSHLLTHREKGTKQTHLLARSCVAQGRKLLGDKERKITRHVSVGWLAVSHPEYESLPLWLLVVRDRKPYQPPLYLLTSVPIRDLHQVWELVHNYMHRYGSPPGQIEQAFRASKAELGMESPRLWLWENRLNRLSCVSATFVAMTCHQQKHHPASFLALTSLTIAEFDYLLHVFTPLWGKYYKYHTLEGKKRVFPAFAEHSNALLKGTDQKLFFLLVYMKKNPLQTFPAASFGISQAKVSKIYRILLAVLDHTLARLKLASAATWKASKRP